MLESKKYWSIVVLVMAIGILGFEQSSYGEAAEILAGTGSVRVDGSDHSDVVDPENPENPADPGESPSTKGPLRIDFIPALNFGRSVMHKKERAYPALAQQFFDETGPRGSYVQITDQRSKSTGWSLQMKQHTQFQNAVIQKREEQELLGAYLSLDNGWAKSSSTSPAPTVTRETIALNSMDTVYEVATATKGAGRGVWTIAFGASETNSDNQTTTLKPLVDKEGHAVLDEEYQKPAYTNSAITLTVPNAINVYPVQYETKITWILAELP